MYRLGLNVVRETSQAPSSFSQLDISDRLDSLLKPPMHMRPYERLGDVGGGATSNLGQIAMEPNWWRRLFVHQVVDPIQHKHAVLLDQLIETFALRTCRDPHVKFRMIAVYCEQEVGILVAFETTAQQDINALGHRLQPLFLTGRRFFREQPRGLTFQRLANDEAITNVPLGGNSYSGADLWPAFHQTLRFETLDGFRDRRQAHA